MEQDKVGDLEKDLWKLQRRCREHFLRSFTIWRRSGSVYKTPLNGNVGFLNAHLKHCWGKHSGRSKQNLEEMKDDGTLQNVFRWILVQVKIAGRNIEVEVNFWFHFAPESVARGEGCLKASAITQRFIRFAERLLSVKCFLGRSISNDRCTLAASEVTVKVSFFRHTALVIGVTKSAKFSSFRGGGGGVRRCFFFLN